jgi:hypothetical protein
VFDLIRLSGKRRKKKYQKFINTCSVLLELATAKFEAKQAAISAWLPRRLACLA